MRCPRLVLTTVAAAVAAVAAAAALVAGPVHRAGDGGAAALRATVEVPAEAEAVVGNAIRIAGVLSGPMPPGRRLLGIVHDGRDQYYPALAQLSAGGRWWADLAIGPAAMLSRTHAFELIVATGDERAMAAIAEWHHTKAVDGMSRLPDGTARLASRNVRRLR